MIQINDRQLQKLLDDIASIKSVISENHQIIKQLLLPIHFRVISFLAAIFIIGLSAAYYYFLLIHGSYYQIPKDIRIFLLIVIGISYLTVVSLKRILWIKSVHKINKEITFGQLVKNIYSYQLFHVWIPIFALMIYLIVHLCLVDAEYYIVGVASIGMGIIYNSIGGFTRIWQYLVTGYWLIVTGLLSLLFDDISPFVWLAVSPGLGFFIFALISGNSAVELKEE